LGIRKVATEGKHAKQMHETACRPSGRHSCAILCIHAS